LAGNIVFSMARDQDGAWWFGTNKGVSRYDGKHWLTLSRGDGLFGDSVYAVAVAPDGDVWAGTKQGVARIGR
jgi:ligand-binding sensor domain-containing protein